jgi:hypothetical protein
MRQFSHTPGPWVAVGEWVEHPDSDIPDICRCDPEAMDQEHLGRSYFEAAANARLIAAAPELLAAAQRALRVLKTQGESVRPSNVLGALEAAIQKATTI